MWLPEATLACGLEGVEADLSDEQTSQIFFLPRTDAVRLPSQRRGQVRRAWASQGRDLLSDKQADRGGKSKLVSFSPSELFCLPWLLFISPVNSFWPSFSEQRFWPGKKLPFIECLLCAVSSHMVHLVRGRPELPHRPRHSVPLLRLPHIYFW